MRKIIYFTLMTMLIMIGCSKNEYPVYSEESYIYFENDSSIITSYTFFFTEETETDIDLRLKLIGNVVDRDQSYSVKFVESESTAVPGIDFKPLHEEQYFRAGNIVDSLTIRLLKSSNLEEGKEIRAVFELTPLGDLKPAIKENSKAIILISNKVSRPEWWDNWHVRSGLGEYSDTKYGLFVRWIGVNDLDFKNRSDITQSDVRAWVLKFKYMLKENPQEDENGPMAVAMRG